MVSDSVGERERLHELVENTPYGQRRMELSRRLLTLAGDSGDDESLFAARRAVIESGIFGGHPDEALAALNGCLAQCNQDPQRFDERHLLWSIKWVISNLPDFPDLSAERMQDLLHDVAERVLRLGFGHGPVHYLRFLVALETGDLGIAAAARDAWIIHQRNYLSDCPACELNRLVEMDLLLGHEDEAYARARPLLDGRLTCMEVPRLTLGTLLFPLLRRGRTDDARRACEQLRPMLEQNPEHAVSWAAVVEYFTATGQTDAAIDAFAEALPMALATTNPRYQFLNALAGWMLAQHLAMQLRDVSPMVEALEGHRLLGPFGGRLDPAALPMSLRAVARDLADRFDRRNGNDFFSQRVAERMEWIHRA